MSRTTPAAAAATLETRSKAFDRFIEQAQKDEPGSVFRLDGDPIPVEVIPTGVISLDVALGVGGLPRGRLTEVYGTPSGGKTALSLQVCANAQRLGGYAGFVDAEYAFDRSWAQSAFGIDPSRFAFAQPDDGTDALRMVERMCRSNAFDVIVIDSVTALLPRERAEAEFGEANRIGMHAKMMSEGLNKLGPSIAKSRAVVVFVNQIREDPGKYGNPEYTPGGKALGFYTSVRIEVRSSPSKQIKGPGGIPIGQECTAKVVKNKVAPPHRIASWELYYETGISTSGALLDAAEKLGVVERRGSSYTDVTSGARLGVGKDAVKRTIEDDPELADHLERAVYAALSHKSDDEAPDGDVEERPAALEHPEPAGV